MHKGVIPHHFLPKYLRPRPTVDTLFVNRYLTSMIVAFKSRALKRYWTKGDASALRPDWVARIRLILSRLDVATAPEQMDLPGLSFHALKGDLAGRYSILVSRNWRITFGWDATDVELEDYHGH